MVEVYKNLFVGSETDYEVNPRKYDDWYVVHACKEPYHRRALGYTGRAAPKTDPRYLYLYDNHNHLVMNIVDVPNPSFFDDSLIDQAINYCIKGLKSNKKVLIHCNQGESRAPTIALMVLKRLGVASENFDEAVENFTSIYPDYNPGKGIYQYAENRWDNI